MTIRFYSSVAGKMVLQLGITAVATTIQVDTTTGLPGVTPFTLLIDAGAAAEEIVTVTRVSGTLLTVTRGEDNSTAQAHSAGAVVRHGVTARDFADSRTHENASAGVHGVVGNVVGTNDTQSLSNKNLTSSTNLFPASLATTAALNLHSASTVAHGATGANVGTTNEQALYNKDLSDPTNIFPASLTTDAELGAHTSATAAHGATGAVVGTTNAQTLTNKTIDGASNTLVVPQSQVTGLVTALSNLTAADVALDGRLDALEAAPTWSALSGFATGASSDASSPAQYSKNASTGRVELRGRINAATSFAGSGIDIVTLPSGFRPAFPSSFPVARSFTSSNTSDARVTIQPTGILSLFTPANETFWFSLDGIFFYTS